MVLILCQPDFLSLSKISTHWLFFSRVKWDFIKSTSQRDKILYPHIVFPGPITSSPHHFTYIPSQTY